MEELIKNLKIDDQIDETLLQNLYIDKDSSDGIEENYLFQLDEWAVFTKAKFIEKLRMKFIKLYTILRMPLINFKKGSCEWRIRGKDKDIYIIKCSDKDIGKSLLERENWIITSNIYDKDKIKKFLKHFADAVQCYDTYYTGIESGNFTSDNKIVQDTLNEIKTELFINSATLNKKF